MIQIAARDRQKKSPASRLQGPARHASATSRRRPRMSSLPQRATFALFLPSLSFQPRWASMEATFLWLESVTFYLDNWWCACCGMPTRTPSSREKRTTCVYCIYTADPGAGGYSADFGSHAAGG